MTEHTDEINDMLCTDDVDVEATGNLVTELHRQADKEQVNNRRDEIARDM